jgi:hypothetical protein
LGPLRLEFLMFLPVLLGPVHPLDQLGRRLQVLEYLLDPSHRHNLADLLDLLDLLHCLCLSVQRYLEYQSGQLDQLNP